MVTTPATGSVAERSPTISTKVGIAIAARASKTWSDAVETVVASKPLGSVYVVWVIPSSRAVASIF